MSNRRMIVSDMWEDDFFIALTFLQRLVWIGIITERADDQGRLQDNASFLRSHLFPNDDVDIKSMEDALISFDTAHKILRYVVGDKKLIQILNWWKHQKPTWAAPSLYPAPEGWMDRCRYNGPGNKQILVNWDKEGGFVSDNIPDNIPADIPDNIPNRLSLSKDKGKEGSSTAPCSDPFDAMQHLVEHMTGYGATQRDIQAIKDLVKAEVTEVDISAALTFLEGKKRVQGAADLASSAIVAHGKRIQAANKLVGGYTLHLDNVEVPHAA
jgi:hypothetical protein